MPKWLRSGTLFVAGNLLWDWLTVVLAGVLSAWSAWLARQHLKGWQVLLLALAVFLIAIWALNGVLYFSRQRYARKRHFKNRVVKLADLVDVDANKQAILEGYVFENCVLVGPAVLYILPGPPDAEIVGPFKFSGHLDAFILPLNPSVKNLTGVIGIRGVRFLNPEFRWVSIVADEQRAADMKRALLDALTTGKRTELRHGQPLGPKTIDLKDYTVTYGGDVVPKTDVPRPSAADTRESQTDTDE